MTHLTLFEELASLSPYEFGWGPLFLFCFQVEPFSLMISPVNPLFWRPSNASGKATNC